MSAFEIRDLVDVGLALEFEHIFHEDLHREVLEHEVNIKECE